MKTIIILAFVVAAALAAPVEKEVYDLEKAEEIFKDYIVKYEKTYKDDDDKQVHFEAFKETLKRINEVNTGDYSHTAALNDRSDYTDEERKHSTGLIIPTGV